MTMRSFSFCLSIVILYAAFLSTVLTTHAQSAATSAETAAEASATTSDTATVDSTPASETTETPAAAPAPQAALSGRTQERIINLAANISNRMDAVIVRFEKIIVRIERRITKLEATGINTSAAEAELADAKASLDAARVRISPIDTLVYTSVTSESPLRDWPEVKATYQATKTDLGRTKETLRSVLTLLENATTKPPTDSTQTATSAAEAVVE